MTGPGHLQLHNVTKSFGGVEVIRGVSLDLPAGSLLGVIGPNGAGKTTLFNLVTGRVPLSSGEVLLDGQGIGGLKPHQIVRRGITRSFQINNLYPTSTVFEQLRLAALAISPVSRHLWKPVSRENTLDTRVHELLELTGLEPLADQRADELSYGDQRHLEIALALASDPRILLLDEPSSGMSAFETARTVELVKRIAPGRSVILIEHDLPFVMGVSKRIMVMHQGQKLADGTPEEVAADPAVQEAYLGGLDA